ncbi:MAG: hypothetical protein A2091_10750 [Desulfuromonadales bacterium GWD2_61_12]|nr:MAG: hypothetical protein A2091_10750 [Desulfuromonadales bacterium GWD2_61_12]
MSAFFRIFSNDGPVSLSKWGAPIALVILALVVYINSFPSTFILDDHHIVQKNHLVLQADFLAIFRSDYWFGVENSGLYRPLTIFSLALNRLIFGESAWGYHLVNLLLHASIVQLIFATLRKWEISNGTAFMAAAIFAVHPIHGEVVNIAVGRSELLVALFLLCGFYFSSNKKFTDNYIVCMCFFAALLAKEHAITFLLLLPLWEVFHCGTMRVCRQRWKLYFALFCVSVVWIVLYNYAPEQTMPRSIYSNEAAPLAYVSWGSRVLTSLLLQWLYLAKLLVPFGLQAVYSTADLPSFVTSVFSATGLLVIGGTLMVALLVMLGWRSRNPLALFAMLYIVSFSTTANLFFPIGVSFAERLVYFPSIWYCSGFAVMLGLMQSVRGKVLAKSIFTICLLFLSVVTLLRNPLFSSETRLWNAEVANNPKDFLAWHNLAESLANSRRYVESESAYQQVLDLAPEYPGGLRAYSAFLRKQGRYNEALQAALSALEIARSRNDITAMSLDHVELAGILVELGSYRQAIEHIDQVDPRMGVTTHMLTVQGKAMYGLGRYREAVAIFEKIALIDKQADIAFDYALALLKLNRYDEARHVLEEGVRRRETAERWNLLGVVCAQQGDWSSAIAAFELAVKIDHDNRNYIDNLLRASENAAGVK